MKKRIPITELTCVNMDTVNMDELVDVSSFTFDNTIPQEERVERIVEAVKNLYCFRVGDMGVKLEFSDDAPPLHDTLTAFLTRQKSGL